MFAKSRLKFIGKEVLCNGLLCVQCAPIKEIKFVAQSVTAFQSSTQKSKCWESRIVIYFLQILLEVKTKLHEITNKLSWFSCNLSSTLLLAVVLLFEFCMQLSIKLTNSCKGLNFSKCQLVNVKISSHFSAISIDDQCETKTNGISFLFTNGFLNASYQKSQPLVKSLNAVHFSLRASYRIWILPCVITAYYTIGSSSWQKLLKPPFTW